MGNPPAPGRLAARHLSSFFTELECVVSRHGYLRTAMSALTLLATAGALGQVLGLTWLRTTVFTLFVALVLLSTAVSFAMNSRLRDRLARVESMLHDYVLEFRSGEPMELAEWHEEILLQSNGDASITRTAVPHAAHEADRKYLTFTTVYYGEKGLTEREKRRVTVTVTHADSTGIGPRAESTHFWTTPTPGHVRHTVFAHLGRTVRAGDSIVAEWNWPGYSRDLMRGRTPETFDVLFEMSVERFSQRVTFRVDPDRRVRIRNLNAPNLKTEPHRDEMVVEFSGESPPQRQRMGFIADLS
ncbi:hypothetical protein L3Q67_06435 [Saccharothrix sp. AJ9571]|nr:hypothetical protein L3Q67_06435 [Saccharothrix sp. AJ9571]